MKDERNEYFYSVMTHIDLLSETYDYSGLEDNGDGLAIKLSSASKKELMLHFEYCFAFKVSVECVKSLKMFKPGIAILYKSNKTEFTEEFHRESVGIYLDNDIFEVSTLTNDHWIRVLVNEDPVLVGTSIRESINKTV